MKSELKSWFAITKPIALCSHGAIGGAPSVAGAGEGCVRVFVVPWSDAEGGSIGGWTWLEKEGGQGVVLTGSSVLKLLEGERSDDKRSIWYFSFSSRSSSTLLCPAATLNELRDQRWSQITPDIIPWGLIGLRMTSLMDKAWNARPTTDRYKE